MNNIVKCIHYCWYGKSPKPQSVQLCINSWKQFCPDWEIVEWNENNSDFSDCNFATDAYRSKKWAFVSDYMRAKILFEYGGLFLDTDVELIKSIDELTANSFLGFEQNDKVNPGLIMFAKEPRIDIYKCIVEKYLELAFDANDMYSVTSPIVYTKILCEHGLRLDGKKQKIHDIIIYPTEYFNPIGNLYGGKPHITTATYSIHHFDGSWFNEQDQELFNFRKKHGAKLGTFLFCVRHPIKSIRRALR